MPTEPHFFPTEAAARLAELARRWAETDANERAAFQPWLLGFCEALGVEAPDPPTDDYRFELPIRMVDREGRESTNFIDCWKTGHFALEAKAFGAGAGSRDEAGLRKAFGQVRNYVAHVPGDPPPYLMVVDVARTLIVWDRWSGSYGDYAAGRRIALTSLHERPDDIELLYDIFARPSVRDPRGRAQIVTKAIAGRLAELAADLEDRGLDTERVARFLMRCVFSCFAEDVGLLPRKLFRRTLETARESGDASRLTMALTALWTTMDQGGMFGAELLRRFNGHFFRTVESLPLSPRDVELLIEASRYDWSRVEPSIFGTLLVRALDPGERHRLGAEYTPREYIERLVEPTVVEPIRERWTAVQAAVLQLEEQNRGVEEKKAAEPKVYRSSGRKTKPAPLPKPIAEAVQLLLKFHEWMRGLSFLDPACGSGNFLYVTMAAVKRIELEVLNEIQRLSRDQGGLVLDEVHPRQFHGIEVKPWAREIAELTLWIGYHQFWRETHGGRTPPDPVLEDTGTIECRDAVLAWDEIVHRPERDRPDPTPRIVSPVTGELVPDPAAKLPYYEYVGARQAEWPRADFIVGNPPYMGQARQREAFGDGYVEALRRTYRRVPDTADYVMYWWYRASDQVASGRASRAGLITTNSISQAQSRQIIEQARVAGARVIWAIADHPWSEQPDSAAVRVTMTVVSSEIVPARVAAVGEDGRIQNERLVGTINSDLSSHANIAGASTVSLHSNAGLAVPGFKLHGAGFIVPEHEAHSLLTSEPRLGVVLKPYLNGKDVSDRPRGAFVIDFGLTTEVEARDYPQLFDIVRDRVKPERDANRRRSYSTYWWRFGEPRRELREAMSGLRRFIVTPETAKHRVFSFVDANVAPDNRLIVFASDESLVLGQLSARIHREWALAAGARLEDRPVYAKSTCFDSFPFAMPAGALRERISALAERLDAHRKSAIARDERVTMTGMYNVVGKLRSGEALTPKERTIHELAACGVLKDLHDELDVLVAEAYGWPWPMEKEEILERLVALHDERVEEEKRGIVRWLRPEYQIPRFGADLPSASLDLSAAAAASVPSIAPERRPWPKSAVEQLSALGAIVAQRAVTVDEAAATFTGAKVELVSRHLETLALMGEVTVGADGRYAGARKAA